MKDSLKAGLSTTRRFTVDEARTVDFLGDDRVYSTPALVGDIETTCREMLLEHLDAGEDTLGIRVELDHLAPTLMGMWVEVTASVAEVDGRMVVLDVAARDPVDEKIAACQHRRFVIDVAKTGERLAAKAAKAKDA